MNYKDIKSSFNKKDDIKVINFNGCDIEVKQHLSSKNVNDLIDITSQQSLEGGIHNRVLLEVNLAINFVLLLTDIEFDAEDKIDRFELYDEITNSGLYAAIAEAFPNFVATNNTVYEMLMKKEEYLASVSGIINKIIQDLPAQAEAMADIINNFDPNKFEAVKAFAEAANGGRPIE